MSGATGFTGRVQNEAGEPLDGVHLYAYGPTNKMTWAWTNGVFGYYDLPPGEYRLEVDTGHNVYHGDRHYMMFKPEWFDDEEFWSDASLITVVAGQMVSNINFTLARRASIQGRVTDLGSGVPLSGFTVSAQHADGGSGDSVTSDASGDFTLFVNGGSYRIHINPGNQPYSAAYYDNKDYLNADLVPVTLGQVVTNINFRLTRFTAGSISGQVTAPGAGSLQWITITASGEDYKEVYTSASGMYSLTGLKPGWYRVGAFPYSASLPYFEQYYCGQYDQQVAHLVQVIAGRNTTNINFQLQPVGELRGQARKEAGTPLPDLRIVAEGVSGTWTWQYVTTDAEGFYHFDRLLPGEYTVYADTENSSDNARPYVSQYFSNQVVEARADLVRVPGGGVASNVDFVLAVGAQITGTASYVGGGAFGGGPIYAWAAERDEYYRAILESGHFVFMGLPPGNYILRPGENYSSQLMGYYYHDKLSRAEADVVAITGSETVSNIVLHAAPPGKISGMITTSGVGVREIEVVILTPGGIEVDSSMTDNSGNYESHSLLPGNYVVGVKPGYHNYYNNRRYAYHYYGGTRAFANATLVAVTENVTTPNVNISIDTVNGRILGRVTRAADGQSVVDRNVHVELSGRSPMVVVSAYTDANGNYIAQGLPPGSYRVRFPDDRQEYHNQYYSQVTNAAQATLVTVGNTDVNGVDFALTEWPPYYVPRLLAPLCATSSRPPTFVWTATDSALQYELQVNDLTAGSNDVIRVAGLMGTNHTPVFTLEDNHQYEARIRAGNTGGYGRWSDPVPFMQLPPPSYQLTVQTNGPGAITLEPPGGLYPEGTVVQITAQGVDGSRFDSWTGEISNRFASVTWVDMTNHQTVIATFLPNRAPAQPVSLTPTNGSLAVSFAASLGASAFADPDADGDHAASQWVVNRAAGGLAFDSGPDAVNLTSLPLTLAGLDGNAAYAWQVRYQDQHGLWSPWSAPAEFTMQNRPPQVPVCLDPAHASTNASLQPILLSSAFSDRDSLDTHAGTWVQLAASTNLFDAALFETNGIAAIAVPVPLGLLEYSTYYWRVQHRDNHDAWSGWSSPARFTVTVTIDGVVELPDGSIQLAWPSKLGWRYTLQTSPDLLAGPWDNVSDYTELPGTGAIMTYQGATSATNGLFYRIAAHPE